MYSIIFSFGKDDFIQDDVETSSEAIIWNSINEAKSKGYYQFQDQYSDHKIRVFMNNVNYIEVIKNK